MNFLNNIERYSSNICLIDKNKKTFLYKDVLEIGEKISRNLRSSLEASMAIL